MRKNALCFLIGVSSALVCVVPSASAASLTESLQQGSSVKINFRTRFEDVTEDVLDSETDRKANAWTTRSRISYQSGAWEGFSFLGEMDNVSEMTNDVDYRTSAANVDPLWSQRESVAVIADPIGTEVNQAFVAYGDASNQVKYGRQRLILDNSRFVGNVGWRQNEQTYDGLSWMNKSITNTNFTYAYVKNVNRVFGEDNPALGDLHMDSHLLNLSFAGFKAGKLIGYAYLLDINDPLPQQGLTGDTFGVRWQGNINTSLTYNLEFAAQQNAGINEEFDADYALAEVVYNLSGYSFTLGYEELGSDDGLYGFATPLATLHAFQGWADKFLSTPSVGLRDVYLNIGFGLFGAQALLSYHNFDASEGSGDFGDEIDVSVSKKVGAVVITAKLAEYSMGDANANYTDTTKYWLMVDWNF